MLQKRTILAQFMLGIMAVSYFSLGMYIKYQQDEINQTRYLLSLSLQELANIRI